MSIDLNEIQLKAQKFLNLYSFYMSSYKQSLSQLFKLVDGFYGYMNEQKKKIIDKDDLVAKRKEKMMEDEEFSSKYNEALRGMSPSLDTPAANLLVSTLLGSKNLENDLRDRLDNDPRFNELKSVEFNKLLTHIKNAIIVHSMDSKIKEIAEKDYISQCQINVDYIEIAKIEVITYLAILMIREKEKGNMQKKKTSSKSDKGLIIELLSESKRFSKHRIDDLLQQVADRTSNNEFSPVTYIVKERDRTLGSYTDEFHVLNINSMLFYNSYLDSSYDNFPVIVEILETVEHESAHSNNHLLSGLLFSQIYKNNVSVEDIVRKLEEDPKLFIAAATLIESSYTRIVENKSLYTSLIDEQNSRNQEFRFLEDLYGSIEDDVVKHKIACMYDLTAKIERRNSKVPHLEIMISSLKNVINLDESNNELLQVLNKIINAMELLLQRKVNDEPYELYFMKKYFPNLHDEVMLSRHSVDDEDPTKKELGIITSNYINNLYVEEKKKRD